MSKPMFAKGDRVAVNLPRSGHSVRAGIYEIVRVLPEGSDGIRYRAKSSLDEFERVFSEAELVRVKP